MCAIMGIIGQGDYRVDIATLKKMQSILKHRGPDDSGLEIFNLFDSSKTKNIGIAFDRLSIRDLSLNGHQPMWLENHDVMIAFNGEIYNSEELRPILIKHGIKFKGHSDTEVVLHLYSLFGIDKTLSLLDGMFAICFVDFRNQELYLVRDRIGEKPLYIYETNKGEMLFASEHKAFYACENFIPELDEDSLNEYLMFRYVSGSSTFLKGVRNLEPGHYLKYSKKGFEKIRYWDIPNSEENHLSKQENKEKLNQLIEKSVQRRLISDVPVGIQLSGGIDSSYLAAVVANEVKSIFHAYGIVFANQMYSEEKYIDFVSDKIKCNLHKFRFDSKDFLTYWRKSILSFEAPMNHEGTVALCLLNEEAKKNVSVLLCGDGPDELLGGYSRLNFVANCMQKQKENPEEWKQTVKSVIESKHPKSSHWNNMDEIFICQSQYIDDDVFIGLRPNAGQKAINAVYKKRLKIMESTSGKSLRKYMNYEISTYMQDILMRSDKISMAASIELRVPYLMPELIEYIMTIPTEYLIDGKKDEVEGTKMLLKELASAIFGNDFTYRKKMGLSFPLLDYFTSSDVEEYIENELLPSLKKRNLINYDYLISLWNQRYEWKEGKNFRYTYLHALWCAFSFEIWMQSFLNEYRH